MDQQTQAIIPQHELVADIDSYRMGLWWLMMHRGQGHLAHRVLRTGLIAMQRLWMILSWDEHDPDEWILVQDACKAFYHAMEDCVVVVGDKGQVLKYKAKVEELGKRLYDMQRLKTEAKGPVYRGMSKAVTEYRSRRGWDKATRHTMKQMPPVGPLKPIQGELFPPGDKGSESAKGEDK